MRGIIAVYSVCACAPSRAFAARAACCIISHIFKTSYCHTTCTVELPSTGVGLLSSSDEMVTICRFLDALMVVASIVLIKRSKSDADVTETTLLHC